MATTSIDNEPRALTAALSSPAFATRGGGMALHVANRHVERWAPEASASKHRSMRSTGFVDRLIAPWIQAAQRSASLRMFDTVAREGAPERAGTAVSWVFPRPWYQDELDWMAAARLKSQQRATRREAEPQMFTTRGTYVAASQAQAMSSALYEFVAPSLSIATPTAEAAGIGYGGDSMRGEAYSPLVPLAAVQAASLMSRTMAPALAAGGATASQSMLRSMLASVLQRTTAAPAPSRLAAFAPELVTPPAPREDVPVPPQGGRPQADDVPARQAIQLAAQYAEQRARIAEVQRAARQAAEREHAAQARPDTGATAATSTIATAELRESAQRAEAQLREKIAARNEQLTHEQRRAAEAERARVEERVAQRLAERTQAQRLHEQSRAEAAAHARAAALEPVRPASEPAPVAAPSRAPAEVLAAIAALPPELASYLGQRPERAMQTILELDEAFRAVELMARGAASGASFEPTRGPRMMMPAGIGGLVAAVDHAQALGGGSPSIGRAAFAMPAAPAAQAQAPARIASTRAPSLPWLAPQRDAIAPTSALGATLASAPAGLEHVAWADRWLARFAGASPQSLDTYRAAAEGGWTGMQALAAAAPSSVFVAPMFDAPQSAQAGRPQRAPELAAPIARPAAPVAQPAPQVMRFADDAETPDDVFASIAAAAARGRMAPQTARPAAPAPVAQEIAADRPTIADAIAHAAPMAPGAGLAAQLASSPFAAALRHVLPLASAPSFDVRALFGGGLASTYLAGLLEPMTRELEIGSYASPAWASWSDAAFDEPDARMVPSFDPTYVAPDALAQPQAPVASIGRADDDLPAIPAALAQSAAPLTTLRSALLSWDVDATQAGALFASAPSVTVAPPVAATSSPARSMLDAMSLPMLGDLAGEPPAAWSAPGMLADRAHAWSVAHERSTSDLSFDFVPPELVLAARVYGLGPIEAAQAARLALAGPGGLSAMASTVDRTFVQAMEIEAERRARGEARSITTAYPVSTASAGPAGSSSGDGVAFGSAGESWLPHAPSAAPGTAFGIERRQPRGAFLWPQASMAALGLDPSAPDGQQSMSVAALELLAAQAVAEIGTFTALGEIDGPAATGDAPVEAAPQAAGALGSIRRAAGGDATSEPSESDVLGAASSFVPQARRARFDALYLALGQSPEGRSWSPAARAARALALAGRGEDGPVSAYERATTAWDVLPVVYATEAGESGGSSSSDARTGAGGRSRYVRTARTRTGELVELADPSSDEYADRATLGAAARAGEALTYIAPSSHVTVGPSQSSGSSNEREVGAVLRAPTAAQELVRTGRPSGRYGGGEVEIPTWFEAAARRMLEERSGASDGISLAELTLISAAPSSHIAASTRSAPAPVSPNAGAAAGPGGSGAGSGGDGELPFDLEKVASDIYRHITVVMDSVRIRNGEPYR